MYKRVGMWEGLRVDWWEGRGFSWWGRVGSWRQIITSVRTVETSYEHKKYHGHNRIGRWRAGAYTKRNMLTEVDHIGYIQI